MPDIQKWACTTSGASRAAHAASQRGGRTPAGTGHELVLRHGRRRARVDVPHGDARAHGARRRGCRSSSRRVHTVTSCPAAASAVLSSATCTFCPPASTPPTAASGLACSDTIAMRIGVTSSPVGAGGAGPRSPRARARRGPGRRPSRRGTGPGRTGQHVRARGAPAPCGPLPARRRARAAPRTSRSTSVEQIAGAGRHRLVGLGGGQRDHRHAQVHGLQQGQPERRPAQRVHVDAPPGHLVVHPVLGQVAHGADVRAAQVLTEPVGAHAEHVERRGRGEPRQQVGAGHPAAAHGLVDARPRPRRARRSSGGPGRRCRARRRRGGRARVPHQVVEVRDVHEQRGRRGRPGGAGWSPRAAARGVVLEEHRGHVAAGTPAQPPLGERRSPRAAAGRRRRPLRPAAPRARPRPRTRASPTPPGGRRPTGRAREASDQVAVGALDEGRGPGAVDVPDDDVHEAGSAGRSPIRTGSAGHGQRSRPERRGQTTLRRLLLSVADCAAVGYPLSPSGAPPEYPRIDRVSPPHGDDRARRRREARRAQGVRRRR